MKHFLLSLLIVAGFSVSAQVHVTILPGSWSLCYGAKATFKAIVVPDTVPYSYTWKRNGIVIPSPDTVGALLNLTNITYADSGYYTCTATSQYASGNSDTARLHMFASLRIDTLYRYNPLGCPGTCKGQMKALVSGGNPPYYYDWGAGHSQDTIVYGLCKGTFTLKVTDSDNSHCISRQYTVDVLKLPKVVFTMDPKDTVYLTKPYLTVAFPDSSTKRLTNWEWNFGDSTRLANVNPAQHTYSKTGRFLVSLNYTDQNGCDTTITDSITVKQAKLKIPNAFSPNNDPYQTNEYFVIQVEGDPAKDINEIYLSTELIIVNRWGRKVYEASPYVSKDKVEGWKGEGLADGVYYYVLKCHGLYEDDIFRGLVTILR